MATKNDSGFNPIGIKFPTDSVTVKELIDVNPDGFTWDWPETQFFHDPNTAFAPLTNAMLVERDFAAKAYNQALGEDQTNRRVPESKGFGDPVTKESLLPELSEAYQQLGVSSGLAQTKELARDIVKQAVAQTQSGPGKSR